MNPRLDELRAAYDALTARLLGSVDTKHPILLLPVRLETRFKRHPGNGPPQLLVRIYPDDIHVDTHERALTADEQLWGEHFHQAIRTAAGAEDATKAAWRQLVSRFGAPRAAWIAHVYRGKEPLNVGTRVTSWTRAPHTKTFPDRWIATAYRGDQPAVTAWSKAVAATLPTGPTPRPATGTPAVEQTPPTMPVVDDGMRWMIDFKAAEEAGMAVRIPLSVDQAVLGFERLVVAGIRSTNSAAAAQLLVNLLEAQRYSNGVALLPQNTPTNNTEASPSGFRTTERDADATFSVELGADVLGTNAAAAGRSPRRTLARVGARDPGHLVRTRAIRDGTGQRDARRVNKQLWPQDTSWLRRLLVSGNAAGFLDFVSQHFVRYVVARGPLPALRVGNQPYGLLPVTALNPLARRPRSDVEAVFVRRLCAQQPTWRRAAAAARSI